MNAAIAHYSMKPLIDDLTFAFTQLSDTLGYMESGKHFGKIALRY